MYQYVVAQINDGTCHESDTRIMKLIAHLHPRRERLSFESQHQDDFCVRPRQNKVRRLDQKEDYAHTKRSESQHNTKIKSNSASAQDTVEVE